MIKADANLRQFRLHLFAWRTTPRSSGPALSPTDLFFGRRLRRPAMPAMPSSDQLQIDLSTVPGLQHDVKEKQKTRFDASARPLPSLEPGDTVMLRDPAAKAWSTEATVIQPRRPDGLSYNVLKEDGTVTTRTRRQLRKT